MKGKLNMENLKFRGQYIIAPKEIECPFFFKKLMLTKNYILYAHNDLIVTEYIQNGVRLVLLGNIFDFASPIKNNLDILKSLIHQNFQEILTKSERYVGRFVLIFIKNEVINLMHDATATRKIFFTHKDGFAWFSSVPFLLATILQYGETNIPSKLRFYRSNDFHRLNHSNIGATTRYDEISQLLPNHYFDGKISNAVRYWPYKKIITSNIDIIAEQCANIIKGYMQNISARYDLMLPVTAGKDSRLLLAATKNIKNKVYYYINKESTMEMNNNDIRIPKLLLSNLGIDFHIVDPYIEIDEDFKKIYYQNNPYASSKYLPLIYNYHKNFGNRINTPGNVAFARANYFKYKNSTITPNLLTELNKVEQYEYALDCYTGWFDSCNELCKKNNTSILNLFYWEERLANWGTHIQLDKDIAQDEINPYNSRLLIELFLSVDYELLVAPHYIFTKKVINFLWPEVLQLPINPSLKSSLKYTLNSTGLLGLFYQLKKIPSLFKNYNSSIR